MSHIVVFRALNLFLIFDILELIQVKLSLLLKTPLKGIGFLIGFDVGAFALCLMQYVYIYRIDWNREAQKVYNLEFKKKITICHFY